MWDFIYSADAKKSFSSYFKLTCQENCPTLPNESESEGIFTLTYVPK
jgi:hypothetical protein